MPRPGKLFSKKRARARRLEGGVYNFAALYAMRSRPDIRAIHEIKRSKLANPSGLADALRRLELDLARDQDWAA
jgi:hypothetical protein